MQNSNETRTLKCVRSMLLFYLYVCVSVRVCACVRACECACVINTLFLVFERDYIFCIAFPSHSNKKNQQTNNILRPQSYALTPPRPDIGGGLQPLRSDRLGSIWNMWEGWKDTCMVREMKWVFSGLASMSVTVRSLCNIFRSALLFPFLLLETSAALWQTVQTAHWGSKFNTNLSFQGWQHM